MANRKNDQGSGGPQVLLAAVAADQDTLALHPLVVAGIIPASAATMPRRITVFGAGNLVTEDEWSVASGTGTVVTIPVAVTPYVLDSGEVRTIKAATAATNILLQY